MRTIIIVLLFTSCVSNRVALESVSRTEMYGNTKLSGIQQEAVDFVRNHNKAMAEGMAARPNERLQVQADLEVVNNLSRLGDMPTVVLPYYRFDSNKFLEDPRPERLYDCMTPYPEDEIFIAGMENEKITFMVKLEKFQDKIWYNALYGFNWGEHFDWLYEALKSADSPEYRIFRAGGLEFVTYTKGGQHLYARRTGESITPQKLTEFLIKQKELYERSEKGL